VVHNDEPAPFLRVTVGSPIYTADDEKIGKVKEVRDQHFKVETGLLQRDYWLHADCVAQATPDDSVILSVAKADLDQHKVSEPSQAA